MLAPLIPMLSSTVLPVSIDLTAALQPFVWAFPALLAVSALAIVGSAIAPHWTARLCGTERAAPRVGGRTALGHSASRC